MRKANNSLSNCDDEKTTFIIKNDYISHEVSSLNAVREYIKDFDEDSLDDLIIFEVKKISGVKRELIFI